MNESESSDPRESFQPKSLSSKSGPPKSLPMMPTSEPTPADVVKDTGNILDGVGKIIPRSAYIHIPFCRHRCGYCNFALVADRDYLIDKYLDALAIELSWLPTSYELETLFFGGGTPSHLSQSQLERLAEIVATRFTLADDAEVSAECNPNDIDEPTVAGLQANGVNRISLGVQSFQSRKLATLERDHNAAQVERAFSTAQSVFGNVSMDLIFAAPNETVEQWIADLDSAIALSPNHLSAYELTFEKGTQFWNRLNKGTLLQAHEDVRAQMYEATMDRCEAVGLEQYEVSSFARSNFQCRHNKTYWNGAPYFAFGPGASRFLNGVRQTSHGSTMAYLKAVLAQRSPVADVERLEPVAAAKERLAFGLRIVEGVDCSNFESQTGFTVVELLGGSAEMLQQHHLIMFVDGCCRLTRAGRMMADGVAAEILK